jgi:hypothetical protein
MERGTGQASRVKFTLRMRFVGGKTKTSTPGKDASNLEQCRQYLVIHHQSSYAYNLLQTNEMPMCNTGGRQHGPSCC